eukprot:388864-Amphidinium_carterae.1
MFKVVLRLGNALSENMKHKQSMQCPTSLDSHHQIVWSGYLRHTGEYAQADDWTTMLNYVVKSLTAIDPDNSWEDPYPCIWIPCRHSMVKAKEKEDGGKCEGKDGGKGKGIAARAKVPKTARSKGKNMV